jgi:hypothetical protein
VIIKAVGQINQPLYCLFSDVILLKEHHYKVIYVTYEPKDFKVLN